MSALERARIEATERSISAATITSVSASAISATSERSSEPVVNESAVRNSEDSPEPHSVVIRISPMSRDSQRAKAVRGLKRCRSGDGAGAVGLTAVSARMACAPSAEGGIDAQAEQPVDRDREQQQRTDRG